MKKRRDKWKNGDGGCEVKKGFLIVLIDFAIEAALSIVEEIFSPCKREESNSVTETLDSCYFFPGKINTNTNESRNFKLLPVFVILLKINASILFYQQFTPKSLASNNDDYVVSTYKLGILNCEFGTIIVSA